MRPLRTVVNVLVIAFLTVAVSLCIVLVFFGSLPGREQLLIAGVTLIAAPLPIFINFCLLRRRDRDFATAVDNPNATLIFARPRSHGHAAMICLATIALGSALLALGGLQKLHQQIIAGLGAFGLLVVASLAFVRPRPKVLKMTSEGLDYSGFQNAPIAWSDLRNAKLSRFPWPGAIVLEIDEQTLRNRRGLGLRFVIPVATFDVSPTLLIRAITVRLSAFGRNGAPSHEGGVKETL